MSHVYLPPTPPREPTPLLVLGAALLLGFTALGASGVVGEPAVVFGLRVEFLLFALTLAGIAVFHDRTLPIALAGLVATLVVRLAGSPDFDLTAHLLHEGTILLNLLGLLIGFAVLADHFERSDVPLLMPAALPDGVAGPFVLLVMVFVLSAFLDNIAGALIGATAARTLFRNRVHVGYLAALVAASNAGGSGSVLGDTTTTMMWIDGVPARTVLPAYVAAVPALLVCAVFAARQQHALQAVQRDATRRAHLKWKRLAAVAAMLVGAVLANLWLGLPGAGVWAGLLLAAPFVRTDWKVAAAAVPGAAFLMTLVLIASLMPVEALPAASVVNTFVMGFVSAVFDNIPLTKLALDQGGHDWGMLAFAVGYGGSMLWFGSSAGVAVSGVFPEARSVGAWLRNGWHVTLAYVLGFAVLFFTLGWNPQPPHREPPPGDRPVLTPDMTPAPAQEAP